MTLNGVFDNHEVAGYCFEQNAVEMSVNVAARVAANSAAGSKMTGRMGVETVEGGCEEDCKLGYEGRCKLGCKLGMPDGYKSVEEKKEQRMQTQRTGQNA